MPSTAQGPRTTPALVTEALAQLPARIRVGAYPLKILIIDGRSSDRHMVWGLFSANEQAIYLNDEFPSLTHMASTFLHEIMHAVWYAQGIDDDDKEERIVTMLSSGLTQVYRDNAWLAPWIEECFRFDRPEQQAYTAPPKPLPLKAASRKKKASKANG